MNSDKKASQRPRTAAGEGPRRPAAVLATLILCAGVANLNLAVANVALPSIGRAFDAGQASLNLVAVGFSLGLAASVLYLGALGDRHGRKQLLLLGTALAIPMAALAAWAPTIEILFLARVGGGLAAGMAFPTTLSLITALWSGAPRTRAIALWSGIGAAMAALGPMLSGLALEHFWWGAVFVLSIPLGAVAFVLAWLLVPGHVHEAGDPVDNLGGILSVVMVAALVLAINFAPVPGAGWLAAGLGLVALAAITGFYLRQRRARHPLYDLAVAARRTFWVAALAGIIVFGSLMAAMYVGQQYLQNVLGYSALDAGLAILPAAAMMVVMAPLSARLVHAVGSRVTLLLGYLGVLLGFTAMLLLWREDTHYWAVGLAYACVGIGVGLAGTPSANCLTASVPVRRAGMASATADLQRDLGGAILQSIFGVLLTAGYAAAFTDAIAGADQSVSDQTQTQLTKSFEGAEAVAEQHPQYAAQIIAAAQQSFLQGDRWAYAAGILTVLLGAALVWFCYPHRDRERAMFASYRTPD